MANQDLERGMSQNSYTVEKVNQYIPIHHHKVRRENIGNGKNREKIKGVR
jgi:hypothetical protein